jgi:hypothetical protein
MQLRHLTLGIQLNQINQRPTVTLCQLFSDIVGFTAVVRASPIPPSSSLGGCS